MIDGLTLLFVRHGETDWNATRRYQGQTDIPMNERGRTQARRNGEALRRFFATSGRSLENFDLVSSPLVRARETMDIILAEMAEGAASRPSYRIEPRLKELSYGAWEGKLQADLPSLDPDGLAVRGLDPFHWRPAGGESYADLRARVYDWLGSVTRDTLVVAHGGVSRCLEAYALALPESEIPGLPCPQDRVLLINNGHSEWI